MKKKLSQVFKILLIILISMQSVGVYYNSFSAKASDINTIEFERVSVHDPSIIKTEDGTYYVFGSHIAAAKSSDLMKWTSLVEREYQTPENNPIYGNLSKNLAESFKWAGEDDADSKGGYAVWAPDIFWNDDFVWDDGTKGAYMMYYSVSSTYIRSAIGIAVSKDIEGPYQYFATIIYSGFTNKVAYDRNSNVNKHWENTNISKLIDEGIISEPNPNWFTENDEYNNALYPNAIDANILYDRDGNLWMSYGSWSGGIFVLQLDKETGLPIYPGKDGQTPDGRMIDRYFGTKIAGGYGRSIEGPYIVYDEETDYYYLYVSYGGLASDGGYQIRQFRSKEIDGPYVDAKGNPAVFPEHFNRGVGNFPGNADHKDIGNKMIGNFLFKRDLGEEGTGVGTGYLSPGHNSYLIDKELGKEFLVTHTRFPQQGEMHQVRVHQMFKNSDGWPVPTPYEYAGETIKPVTEDKVIGDYKYVNHGKEITSQLTESTWIKLNDDYTISGAVTGTWELYDDYRVRITIDEKTYDGLFIRQYETTTKKWVMTFSAMSEDGVVIWGSHVESKSEEEIVAGIKQELKYLIPDIVITDIHLPTNATQGAQITWESTHPEFLSPEGIVNRPPYGSDDFVVQLKATISLGEVTDILTIAVTVPSQEKGGLSAYYDFNNGLAERTGSHPEAEVTGNRLNNSGGKITFEEGIIGKAARFDGKSGLSLADGLITSYKYSVSLWLKPEEITQFTTTFFGARTENNWISFVLNGHNVTKVWSHNGDRWYDADIGYVIPTGEWTHVAFTVDEGKITVYINGEEKFSGDNFPNVFTTIDAKFGLGVNYWDVPFKGLMDEVRVYNGYVLSAEEVQRLYEHPDGVTTYLDFENHLNDITGSFASGTVVGDIITNSGGNISFTNGVVGKAAVFDGKSGVLLPEGLISSYKYSVSIWVKPDQITEFTTTFFGARATDHWISLVPNGHGVTKVWSHDGGNNWYDAVTGSIIPIGEWTHLAFTVNEGDIKVYVNGVETFSGENFPDIFTTTDSIFSLGVNYWDAPFKGELDELMIYNDKVLTAEEIYDYFISIAGTEEPSEGPGEEPGEELGEEPDKEEPVEAPEEEPGEDPCKEPDKELGKNHDEEPNDSRHTADSDSDGQVLPKTFTNSWNLLLLAAVFLVIAAWLFRVQKKILKTK